MVCFLTKLRVVLPYQPSLNADKHALIKIIILHRPLPLLNKSTFLKPPQLAAVFDVCKLIKHAISMQEGLGWLAQTLPYPRLIKSCLRIVAEEYFHRHFHCLVKTGNIDQHCFHVFIQYKREEIEPALSIKGTGQTVGLNAFNEVPMLSYLLS